MPIYTLVCDCGRSDEYVMAANDVALAVECEACGASICRRTHRDYNADKITIQGDTVAGGVNYAGYWDDGLDAYVTSKKHRADLMQAKGLTEYVPDADTKTMCDEIRHIRKNSDMKTDVAAVAAAREQGKIADQKRKRRAVKSAVDRGIADLKKSMQGV